ncbi:hypothetical protein LXL04_037648 [Taraxacum kok-saghyz]
MILIFFFGVCLSYSEANVGCSLPPSSYCLFPSENLPTELRNWYLHRQLMDTYSSQAPVGPRRYQLFQNQLVFGNGLPCTYNAFSPLAPTAFDCDHSVIMRGQTISHPNSTIDEERHPTLPKYAFSGFDILFQQVSGLNMCDLVYVLVNSENNQIVVGEIEEKHLRFRHKRPQEVDLLRVARDCSGFGRRPIDG